MGKILDICYGSRMFHFDFRNTPFKDNEFDMVIFDPLHLIYAGETWQDDLRAGFNESFRVLRVGGTLVFKWSETQIKLAEIMKLIEYKPIDGNKRPNTHWLIFYKGAQNERI